MTRRTARLLRRLGALEAEFRARLAEQLRICADGRSSLLFLVSSLRPESWPPTLRSAVADELFATAAQILSLRARLELEDDGCLAARFREACHRHVDLDDHHRPGERRQAQLILEELGDEG